MTYRWCSPCSPDIDLAQRQEEWAEQTDQLVDEAVAKVRRAAAVELAKEREAWQAQM